MVDFSTQEGKALFEREVRRRMEAPFHMERTQAEMLVAVLLMGEQERAKRAADEGESQ